MSSMVDRYVEQSGTLSFLHGTHPSKNNVDPILSLLSTIIYMYSKWQFWTGSLNFPLSFRRIFEIKANPRPGGTETYHLGRGFEGIQKGWGDQAKVREPMPTWALVWASKRTMLPPTTFMETGSSTA